MHEKNDFWVRERECERIFEARGPFFMITTAHQDWLLYKTRDEFITGTNLLAVSAGESGFSLVDDVQMNNHHHVIGAGSLEKAELFSDLFREKMRRYQLSLGNKSLKDWEIRIDKAADLKQLRNQVGYTDRNAFVARKDSTPSGYPWGSAYLFFNNNLWMLQQGIAWQDLSIEKRRRICRSHSIELPESYRVLDGMIMRSSFVDYKLTESLFYSANQYFTMLSRRGEADIEIARILGEGIQIPNEEVYQLVGSWYPDRKISSMDMAEKLSVAQKMKKRLSSSNKQIAQILRLPIEEVDRLFPHPI